jgi:neprilysin
MSTVVVSCDYHGVFRVIVNYLMWRTAASTADLLNKQIRNRRLEFSKVLSGRKSFELRWQECIDVVLDNLPIATSALYVKNFFKKESRNVAKQMVESIQEEFQKILENVTWMDDSTRAAAMKKAKAMIAHIGYPDELMNDTKLVEFYDDLTLDDSKYFESVLNVSRFDNMKTMKNLRKAVNKTDWESHANVAVINAFYNPLENSIRKRNSLEFVVCVDYRDIFRVPCWNPPRSFLQR